MIGTKTRESLIKRLRPIMLAGLSNFLPSKVQFDLNKNVQLLQNYTRHDCFNLFVNSIVLGKTPETKKLHLNSKSIFFWPSSLIQDV